MKKTAKLLALALMLCCVFSLASVFAFAATADQLDASALGDNIAKVAYSNKGFSGGSTGAVVDSAAALVNHTTETSGGNTFFRVSRADGYSTAAELEAIGIITAGGNAFKNLFRGQPITKTTAADHTYTVVSFDFMCDRTDENGKLLYCDGSYFGTYSPYFLNSYLVSNEGKWYVGSSNTYNASKGLVPISNASGEWNNMTYVYTGDTIYVFVNGAFLISNTTTSSIAIDRVVYNIQNSKDLYTPFTICVDQYSVATYGTTAAPYVTEDKVGLDDFITNKMYETESLTTLSDVVFNKNYKFATEVENTVDTMVGYVDGVKKEYASFAALIDDVKNYGVGDAIYSSSMLDSHIESRTALTVIKAEGEGIYKYSFIPAYEASTGITAGNLSASNKIGGGVNGGTLTQSVTDGVYDITATTPYTGVSGNVNYYNFFGSSSTFPTSSNYKYATLDFDVSAAEYSYLPDGKDVYELTSTLEGLSETELATVRLSYYYSGCFSTLSGGWATKHYFVVDPEGNPYLSTNSVYGTEGEILAPLKNEVGEWNHITLVYDLAAKKVYSYVNDSFFVTFTLSKAQAERFAFILLPDGVSTYSPAHYNVKGVKINYYGKTYASDASSTGLDTHITSGGYKNNISFVDDVYYSATLESSLDPIKVSTAYGDVYYANVAAAIASIQNGEKLYFDGDLTLFEKIDENVEKFYVEGARSVTLIRDSAAQDMYIYDPLEKTVAKRVTFNIHWLDEDGEEFATTKNDVGYLPLLEYVDYKGAVKGDHTKATAWEWAVKDGEYAPLNSIVLVDAGTTVYVRPAFATVTWKNGKTDETTVEKWFKDETAANDFVGHEALEALNNGWYEREYYWSVDGVRATDFTVSGDVTYVSKIGAVEAFNLSDLKLNFSLLAQYRVNFFVPVPALDEVSVTGARSGANVTLNNEIPYFDDLDDCAAAKNISDIDLSTAKIVTVGDKSYYRFMGKSYTSFAWYAASGFEFNYNVVIDGETYELSSKVAVVALGSKANSKYPNMTKHVSYINTVMNSPCGSEEKLLVLNWMRYLDYSYVAQNADRNHVVTTYQNHYECCGLKQLEDAIPTAQPTLNAPVFKDGIETEGYSASYLINQNFGLLQITVPKAFVDASADIKVYTTFVGIDNAGEKLGTVKYDLIKSTDTTTVDGVECYYFRITTSAGVYNVNALHNITIEVGGEVVGTIQYSLAKYIYTMNAKYGTYVLNTETGVYTESTETKDSYDYVMQLAMALSLYGESVYNYKVTPVSAE